MRSLFTAMLDTRIRTRREIELPFGWGPAVHLMEPRLVYTGVTNASQSDNPLFIPRPRTLQERVRQFEERLHRIQEAERMGRPFRE